MESKVKHPPDESSGGVGVTHSLKRQRSDSPTVSATAAAAAAAASSSESSLSDGKKASPSTSLSLADPLQNRPFPHGTFTGETIYRNKLHGGETFALGHVSLQELIPEHTRYCFATTFVSVHATWLERMFGSRVKKFLLVRHDKRDVKNGQTKVGHGLLEPITISQTEEESRKYQRKTASPAVQSAGTGGNDNSSETKRKVEDEVKCEGVGKKENNGANADTSSEIIEINDDDDDDGDDNDVEITHIKRTIPHWHRMAVRPASGGIQHSKMLLFRTKEGLRVVVSGSNLCPQWTADRDCLWVQDFNVLDRKKKQQLLHVGTCRFESILRMFVQDVSISSNFDHGQYVRKFLSKTLDGIDFATSNAELVYSFPRSRDEVDKTPGGWPMLAKVVERLRGMHSCPNTDDEGTDDGGTDTSGLNVVYAASASFGNFTPAFLRQMYEAMNSGNCFVSSSSDMSWNEVPSAMKCLWPSTETAQSMLPSGVVNSLRNIPMSYWDSIPADAKRRIFHDAKPNTPQSGYGIIERNLDPVVHGKVIFCTPKRASSVFPSIVYVGSHNFSRAAWGESSNIKPKNIELGVVLATSKREVVWEWIHRLPVALPPHNTIRSPGDPYIPASAHNGIRAEWERGDPRVAEEKLVTYLSRGYQGDDYGMDGSDHEDYTGAKGSGSEKDVIDLT